MAHNQISPQVSLLWDSSPRPPVLMCQLTKAEWLGCMEWSIDSWDHLAT
jgi:hypothetical protein